MAEVKGASREGAPAGPVAGMRERDSDPKKMADAAQQFEALLIGQLLKASHGPDERVGWERAQIKPARKPSIWPKGNWRRRSPGSTPG